MRTDLLAVVRGGGDLATGAAYRLRQAGFPVLILELPKPTTIRRTVSFAEAVYSGEVTVEGIRACRVTSLREAAAALNGPAVSVLVDPHGDAIQKLRPAVLVDAIMAKRNTGTSLDDAPAVVGLGPGFSAGLDCHAVIETNRGHDLGRVIWEGSASPNTGVPGTIDGQTDRRVLRAPCAGRFEAVHAIGDTAGAGEVVAHVDGTPVTAQLDGVVRGLLHGGLHVHRGMKVGDVDPRSRQAHCFTISDKSLAVGGAVLAATLALIRVELRGCWPESRQVLAATARY